MIKLELPYVTVTVDDRFRNRLARASDRLRITLTSYLRNAADDLDGLGRAEVEGVTANPPQQHPVQQRHDGASRSAPAGEGSDAGAVVSGARTEEGHEGEED